MQRCVRWATDCTYSVSIMAAAWTNPVERDSLGVRLLGSDPRRTLPTRGIDRARPAVTRRRGGQRTLGSPGHSDQAGL